MLQIFLVIGMCIWHFRCYKMHALFKNSELKITLLMVNIIVNTKCQRSQIMLQDSNANWCFNSTETQFANMS